eukprot:jgi/Picsp_1/1009/NSC_04493-R1_vacuolar membrane pq loop repeat protein
MVTRLFKNESLCDPGANEFIERARDMCGFALGMCSICSWLVSQLPQLIVNYKRKSAEALSPFFLAEWLLGDTTNLLGALLKGDQPQTVVFTAEYFICMDCILLIQYIYYTSMEKRRERVYTIPRRRHRRHRRHHHGEIEKREGAVGSADAVMRDGESGSQETRGRGENVATTKNAILPTIGAIGMGTVLVSYKRYDGVTRLGSHQRHLAMAYVGSNDGYVQVIGSVIGYTSSVLYLVSRASQIYKNYKRKSAEGLSASMFFFAVAANLFYGASVILRSRSGAEFVSSLPWLIGSLGTVALDFAILLQTLVFFNTKGEAGVRGGGDQLESPLLLAAQDDDVHHEHV